MWLAMDHVDEENGCVRYVHGSHEWGMRPHGRTQTLGFSQGVSDYGIASDLEHETALPAQPGDLLVHHCMTIHRADGNQSTDSTRRALGFIYYSDRAEVDEEAHEAYQKRLADEMKEVKTICHCGKKATMVVRQDDQGNVQTGGDQILIGGNDTYVSLCRRHWRQAMDNPT